MMVCVLRIDTRGEGLRPKLDQEKAPMGVSRLNHKFQGTCDLKQKYYKTVHDKTTHDVKKNFD